MTKQHEMLARVIQDNRESFKSNRLHAQFAAIMAGQLSNTNSRFDGARFIMACMPRAWVGTNKANVWERYAAVSQ